MILLINLQGSSIKTKITLWMELYEWMMLVDELSNFHFMFIQSFRSIFLTLVSIATVEEEKEP
jgi:hypothetical protein